MNVMDFPRKYGSRINNSGGGDGSNDGGDGMDLAERVRDLDRDVRDLKDGVAELRISVTSITSQFPHLATKASLEEIKSQIPYLATKTEVSALDNKITKGVNKILMAIVIGVIVSLGGNLLTSHFQNSHNSTSIQQIK